LAIEHILIPEPTPHTQVVRAILGSEVRVSEGPLDRSALLDAVANCDAVFARLGHQFDRELLTRAHRLRVIATPTTGLTHIDVAAAAEAGITVLSLRGATELLEDLPATAELTWGLLLAIRRRIALASRHTAAGGWDRDEFWGSELSGKTLGIIGLGRIGRMVARYGAAFGMRVIACDIGTVVSAAPIELVDKASLLAQSDVVSLHAHYNQGDAPILGSNEFAALKPGCLLVNTARGELIDEAALLEALRTGRVAGAGLDVLAQEPRVNLALVALQREHNVVITPHIGGATTESIAKTELYMARRLREFLDGQHAR
jgi:D-3-phosphoglycerate dehydrogenase / 2-oxoglutarate reductase